MYENVVYNQTAPAVTTTSSQVLAANPNRRALIIQNTGAANVYISFSATATNANMVLTPGQIVDFEKVPTNVVTALGVGASTLCIIEGR